jgi:hypothetical protein
MSVRGCDVESSSGWLDLILALFERYGYEYTCSIVSPNSVGYYGVSSLLIKILQTPAPDSLRLAYVLLSSLS